MSMDVQLIDSCRATARADARWTLAVVAFCRSTMWDGHFAD